MSRIIVRSETFQTTLVYIYIPLPLSCSHCLTRILLEEYNDIFLRVCKYIRAIKKNPHRASFGVK